MAKSDEQLAQEQLAERGVDYRYGGDSIFGAFMPERRRILRPEQEQFVGYDSSGNAIIQNIPAEYGPSEFDPSFSPVVRGARSAGSFLRDIFLGDANEQSAAFGRAASALRGMGEGIADYAGGQARSALAGGVSFDSDTGQVDRFDPLVVMGGGGAPSGSLASGFRMNRRAAQAAENKGFDTENVFLHGTSDRINQPRSSATQSRDSGFIGRGFYGATEPRISDFYANSAPARFRDESGSFSEPNVFPYVSRRGNYKQYSLAEKQDLARRVREDEFLSQEITQKNIDDGFIGAEVVDADGNIIERVNYFPDEDTRSAFLEADLYSGGGNTGTGIAAGSALRESFRIGDEGFDPRFDSRAKEQERIQNTQLDYIATPIERPEVSIFDYEGKPFRLTMSDRTAAGRDLTGVEGVQYDIPVNLQGGQDFMFANPVGREGQVWAQDKGATSAFLNSFQGLDGRPISDEFLILPYRMAPTSGDFATMTGEVMVTHARNNVPTRAKMRADETIRGFYPEWKGIDNPESLQQISQMSGNPRKALLQVMDRDLRNEGGLGIGQARLAVTDRAQYNAPDFNLQNVGIVNPDIDSRFEVSGHRTYTQGLSGRPEGTLAERDINVFELMPDLVRARGFDSVEQLLSSDPATLAKEQYTMRRGIRGGTITEDMLRDIERRRSQ